VAWNVSLRFQVWYTLLRGDLKMLCKKCMKNIATVKFTEVVDGNAVQHHLCRDCYEACQRDAAGFSMEVPKPSLRVQRKQPASLRTEMVSRCLSCGTLLSSIFESAEVGCANCYGTYGKEIESMLEAFHRSLVHRGKSFSCDDTRVRVSLELQSKRLLLRSMLKAEKYEEAARLRDEIAALELQARTAGASATVKG